MVNATGCTLRSSTSTPYPIWVLYGPSGAITPQAGSQTAPGGSITYNASQTGNYMIRTTSYRTNGTVHSYDSPLTYIVGTSPNGVTLTADAGPQSACGPAQSCTWTFTAKIKNTDTVPQLFQIYKNDVPLAGPCESAGPAAIKTYLQIKPGETGTIGAGGLCDTNGLSVRQLTGNVVAGAILGENGQTQCYFDGTVQAEVPNQAGGVWSQGNPGTPGVVNNTGSTPGGGYVPGESSTNTAGYTTNGPIQFGPAVGAASESTLRSGFSAVYDALAKQTKAISDGFELTSLQLSGVSNLVSGSKDLIARLVDTNASGFARVGSLLDQMGSNLAALSNEELTWYASNEFHFRTNVHGPGDSLGTNVEAALEIRDRRMPEAEGQMDQGIAMFQAGVQSGDDGGSGGSPISIQMGDYVMEANLMPGEFHNMWSLMSKIAAWLLLAGFMVKVANDAYRFVTFIGPVQPTSVPNLMGTVFGIGGNWGITVYPLVVTAILVTYAGLVALLINLISGHADWIGTFVQGPLAASGQAGAAVSKGVSWLRVAFPFGLLFDLTIAYIIFKLTLAKAAMLASALIKSLVG